MAMADAEPLPEWELEFLQRRAAASSCDAALRAAHAILNAYERGILSINARYLADTLRMVLDAMESVKLDPDEAKDCPGRMVTRFDVGVH